MTHNLDEPVPYAPRSLGDRLDVLHRDLAETRAGLHWAIVHRDRAQREAVRWKQIAALYRRWLAEHHESALLVIEGERTDLFVGLQEWLDRSA